MQRFSRYMRACAAPLALGLLLAGCAQAYQDYTVRRETISQNGGDAIAANRVTHMVDPWSRASADATIAYNGEKMQSAVERYRRNKVIAPRGLGTSNTYAAPADPATPPPAAAPPAAPAAPVK